MATLIVHRVMHMSSSVVQCVPEKSRWCVIEQVWK